jgi:hypothetical protein
MKGFAAAAVDRISNGLAAAFLFELEQFRLPLLSQKMGIWPSAPACLGAAGRPTQVVAQVLAQLIILFQHIFCQCIWQRWCGASGQQLLKATAIVSSPSESVANTGEAGSWYGFSQAANSTAVTPSTM